MVNFCERVVDKQYEKFDIIANYLAFEHFANISRISISPKDPTFSLPSRGLRFPNPDQGPKQQMVRNCGFIYGNECTHIETWTNTSLYAGIHLKGNIYVDAQIFFLSSYLGPSPPFPPADIATVAPPPLSMSFYSLYSRKLLAYNLAGRGWTQDSKNVPVFYLLIGPWSVMSVWDFNENIREAK